MRNNKKNQKVFEGKKSFEDIFRPYTYFFYAYNRRG